MNAAPTKEYSIFTIDGAMAYQSETPAGGAVFIKRVVQQADGSFWQYGFYKGGKVGVPCRGKARQKYMLQFIEEVKLKLA